MSDVLFKKPDGSFVTVDSSEAQQAQSMGYVPSTPEQMAAGEQTGRAFVEGAARGATFGLSDPLLKTLGGGGLEGVRKTGAEMQARKEENPIASTTGEIGGALGVSLATGGGASALVGGGVRGAAFEGGLYGMGSMVSEAALENRELTSDRLAAGLVGSALAGGVAQGGFSLLGKGVSVGISKFGGKGLKDTLGKAADDIEWKALWGGDKRGAELNAPYKAQILKFGREQGLLGKASSGFTTENAAKARELATGYAEKIAGEMDTLEQFVPLKGNKELRGDFADYLERKLNSAFGDSPAHEEAMKSVKKYAESIRSVDRDWRSAWGVQSTLFKEKVGDTANGEVRERLRQSMRDFVMDEVASGENKAGAILSAFEPRSAVGGKLPRAVAEAVDVRLGDDAVRGPGQFDLDKLTVEGAHPSLKGTQLIEPDVDVLPFGRDIPGALGRTRGAVSVEGATSQPGGVFEFPGAPVRSAAPSPADAFQLPAPKFQPQTVRLGEEIASGGGLNIPLPEVKTPAWFGAQLRQTGREARMAMSLAKAMEHQVNRIEMSSGGGLASLGTLAGLATGNITPALGGVAGDLARGQLRKRGGLMGAAALRTISESSVTNGITKALNGHIGKILATAPEMLGAYRYPLAVAAAQGADALLQEHLRLASSEEGSNYLSTVALEVEDEAGIDAAGARLAVVDALEVASKEHLNDLDGAIDGLFGSARGRKASMGEPLSLKNFKVASESIRKMVSDPTAAFEAVPSELRAGAPSTSAEAAAKLVMMAQYLDSKMPKDPNAGMPPSVAPPWQPSQYDLDKFNRYREAVEDPARVLKNMAAGYISPEQVEAIQAVYPAMYADLQQKIGERLMSHKKPLSYQQRLAMSAIVGPQALGMSLQQQQILQQSQAVATAADQETGNSTSSDGRQDVNQEHNLDTQATRLERR